MEEQSELVDELIEKGHKYGQTTLHLIKLKTLDKTSDVLSNLVSWLPVIIAAIIFFLILNIGVALWLGNMMGQTYYGFFAVAGFYAIVSLICWLFRKPFLKHPLNDSIINQILKEDEL
ncbi:hypothetical protein [Mangrovibacterium lignilyticum]|uniref:hypothetical protein n=1 Tax=Mangrovibacterium lignilyticum TaxID=2668052 RepID=UPI0013D46650|nr:hypothetical protein [Mangrovibacterium lignilyticum]